MLMLLSTVNGESVVHVPSYVARIKCVRVFLKSIGESAYV